METPWLSDSADSRYDPGLAVDSGYSGSGLPVPHSVAAAAAVAVAAPVTLAEHRSLTRHS